MFNNFLSFIIESMIYMSAPCKVDKLYMLPFSKIKMKKVGKCYEFLLKLATSLCFSNHMNHIAIRVAKFDLIWL